jgi:hypothetical protein
MIAYARHLWQRRACFAALVATILAVFAPQVRADALPTSALILFGAHWCAPCAQELHTLPAIVDAVTALPHGQPPQTVLGWIDRPPPVMPALQARVVVLTPAHAQNLAEPLLASAHGLPFSVMTDAHGHVCALHRGPLHPDMIAALWMACQTPS